MTARKPTPKPAAVKPPVDEPEIADWFAADAFDETVTSNGDHQRERSQSTELVALAREQFDVVRGSDSRTYAVAKSNPGIAIPLRGRAALREQLASTFFDQRAKAATSSALADMLNVLEGDALRSTPVQVDLRVAQRGSVIYVDRGAPEASAVAVSADGWSINLAPPVIFRRTALTMLLPEPARGGDLDGLRSLINVSESGFRLLIGWLLAGFVPGIPHPILALLGQQGTAKTSALRMLVSLLDPSAATTRTPPRDEDSWAVTAAHSWVIGLDNVSGIAPWLQDALCKAVTGDGIVRRAKYTDDDVSVLSFSRVIALTSIDPGSLQGDVADRLLAVELEPISPANRRTDRAVTTQFERQWPATLGAVLDLLAKVWGELPNVTLVEMPRMADFARLLAALDVVTGWSTLPDYLRASEEAAQNVIEGDVFASAVRALVMQHGVWTGSASELHQQITPERPPRKWPSSPRAVAGALKRMTPAFAQVGVSITVKARTGKSGSRGYVLAYIDSDPTRPICGTCGLPLDPTLAALGETTHPSC